MPQKEPYWKTKDDKNEEKILRLACELFPLGPPQGGVKWKKLGTGECAKFSHLSDLLLGRSLPSPFTLDLELDASN